jgi:hypothetical protein
VPTKVAELLAEIAAGRAANGLSEGTRKSGY